MGKLAQEQFNLGRALARLGLERLVLGADLSSKPLAERASVANGILKGVLEKGDWQYALRLAYTPGIVSSLFDGNWKSFTISVIEASKINKKEFLDEGMRQLLLKEWAPEDIYELATQSTLCDEDAHQLFTCIANSISDEQAKQGRIMFGERAVKKNNFKEAYFCFRGAGNVQKLNELCDNLIKNMNEFNADFLIDKIEELGSKRIIDIIQILLEDKILQKKVHCRNVATLYTWSQTRQLLDSKQEKGLIDLIAPRLSGYEIRNTIVDEKLKLAWALTNARQDGAPAFSYRLLKELKHEGPEVLEAALNGLVNYKKNLGREYMKSEMQLPLKEIEDKDLKAIFEYAPLEIKAAIAEHLGDKETMFKLSKEFYQRKEEDDAFLNEAYSLAFAAEEVGDEKYVGELRAELIERELKGTPSYYFHWLDKQDDKGRAQAYKAIFKKDPESAFRLAKSLSDEKLMQQARETIVQKSPEYAFDYFKGSSGYDLQGIELALNALSEKYSVSKETLQKTLQPAIQKDSQF